MGPPVWERRCSHRHRRAERGEIAHRPPNTSAGTAWNAGLRPASRGSAKPAPMARHNANLSSAPLPIPDAATAHRSPYPGPRLFHARRGVQEDPIMNVSSGGGFTPAPPAGGGQDSSLLRQVAALLLPGPELVPRFLEILDHREQPRTMPTRGRRSKPSPRFFAVGDARSRCASRRGAGLKTGVPSLWVVTLVCRLPTQESPSAP